MKVFLIICMLCILQLTSAAAADTVEYKCDSWSNAGLRLKGDVKLTLSGLQLEWTNGKISQKATMINPEDKLEFSTTDAKRVYLSDDSTAVFFVKKYQDFTAVLRTLVTVQQTKQNRTICHKDD